MCNSSKNDYIPQEPDNLSFSPIIVVYFAFLIDIIDNIITYCPYSPITSMIVGSLEIKFTTK